MKIIIAGAGEVGTHLAKMLSNYNHEIVVIDNDEDNLEYINNHFDVITIFGSCTSFDVLKEANIKNADLFICVTHTEEINIVAAILGKQLGAKNEHQENTATGEFVSNNNITQDLGKENRHKTW